MNRAEQGQANANIAHMAAEYIASGLALCSIGAGSKAPRARGWNEKANAITNPVDAAQLSDGVGLLHAFSGTMALDIDNFGDASSWLKVRGVDLRQLLDAPDAVAIASGKPGRGKLLFRIPPDMGPIETVQISGEDGMVLEFRCASRDGKSHQDVLPPSIHPETGMPYHWAGSGSWQNIPLIPDTLLACWRGELAIRCLPANDRNLSVMTNRVLQSFPVSDAEEVANNCPVIGEMRQSIGQYQSEGEWRACLGVLLHTTQGETVCHEWSRGHADYSPAETQGKLERLRPFGPTTCDVLGRHRPDVCTKCPQWGQVRSPISLGTKKPIASAVISPAGGGLASLPHRLPVLSAVATANRFFGYTYDWGERGTYFRRDTSGTPFPCAKEEVANAMANRFVIMSDGSLSPLFKIWNSSPDRLEVARVVYAPGLGSIDAHGSTILNLYQGLARQPIKGAWTLMRRHLLQVICRGNLRHYLFLIAWMAHLIQKPAEAPGVVVVLRSLMEGAGKTTVVEWLCAMLGRHALMLNDPTQLLTKFNAHLEDKSFIGVNEPSWPGNKDAEAKLKSMITDPFLTIERKHGGVYSVPNNLHFMFTTNAEWAVPAGAGARRYLVLDVDASKAGDHRYFKALRDEVDNGGLEALLYVLQSFRLDRFDLRSIPVTDALKDQQERSLSLEAQWALDLADRDNGGLGGSSSMFGQRVAARALYDDYTAYAGARRRHPTSSETFGKYLSRIGVPLQRTGTARYRLMPSSDDFAVLAKRGAGVHL